MQVIRAVQSQTGCTDESGYLLPVQTQERTQTEIMLAPLAPSLLPSCYTAPLYISDEKLWKIYGNPMCVRTYLLKPKP